MNKLLRKTFIPAFSLAIASLSAQTKIDSMLIINTGVYQATIADASKISSEPVVHDSTSKIPVKAYSINSKKINTGFDVDPIPAAQMMGDPLTKLYNGLVKLGFGNYTTPYAELWYNNLRSKEYSYGLRLKHLSSTCTLDDYGNSSYSDNEISLYGKKFLKEHTLSGNFDYARNVVHFYGYDASLNDIDKDLTVQRFNLFTANAELQSHYTKMERYNHDVKLSFYNLSDLYQSSENNINLNGYVQKGINKELLKVGFGVDYYNDKTSSDTSNATLIHLAPEFIASGEKYNATLGFKVNLNLEDANHFYFYPHVMFSYNIFENIIVPYVEATGGSQRNGLKSITDENPFVKPGIQFKTTNEKYRISGGLKGTLSSSVAYNASASYSSISDLMLFENDRTDLLKNKFNVIYDDAELLTVTGQVSYQEREKLRLILRGEYFNYTMKNELRAWYQPQLKLSLGANYNLKDKIVVKADLFYLDEQYAKLVIEDETGLTADRVEAEKLKGLFDANIGIEYRYTKKLGFFLNFNNVASVRYYRYQNYPTQKFCVMAGLSYSF